MGESKLANDLKGPGIFEIRRFIKDKVWVEFYTLTDKIFKGQILWFDGESFHIALEGGQEMTILKAAVVYYNEIQA